MKDLFNRTSILFSIGLLCLIFVGVNSQTVKLKTYLDTSKIKDYNSQVVENQIYADEMNYLVHKFEIYSNNQLIETGNIYRAFFRKGAFESFYIAGDNGIVNIGYWSDPTALITSNVNKKEYCIEKDVNARLFPFVLRGYAKMLKSGSLEKPFKKTKYKLTKLSSQEVDGNEYTTYNITSKPNVISGTITCLNKIMIVKADIVIDNDNATRCGLKGLLAFAELPPATKMNLKFDINSMSKTKEKNFRELDIEQIIKNYEKTDCD
jgi:hypothetical protein